MREELEIKLKKLSQIKKLDRKINEILAYCQTIENNKLDTSLVLSCKINKEKSYSEQEDEDYSSFPGLIFLGSMSSTAPKYKSICDLRLDEKETLIICAALHDYLSKQKKQLEDELA